MLDSSLRRNKITPPENGYHYYLENITKSYAGKFALQNINLSVSKNEILFITGASGAGKTSLLNILAGDIKADSGTIKLARSNFFISRVFQDLKLIPTFSVEENLDLVFDSKLFHNRKEFNKEKNELCNFLGILDKKNLIMANANGGLKQKVCIIRALLTRPDVILADEPTCSLDLQSAMKIFDLFNYYNSKRKMTVVWASHNRELVKKFPGRILHLDKGKLVYSGHACFI